MMMDYIMQVPCLNKITFLDLKVMGWKRGTKSHASYKLKWVNMILVPEFDN